MIYGQRVAYGGTVIGDTTSNTLISGNGEGDVYSTLSLAYNTQHKQYLVAFNSYRTSPGTFGLNNMGIYGRRVTLLGIPDPGGDIPIATTISGDNDQPKVVYNATNDQYLSVFICSDASRTYGHVCRQFLKWEGTRLGISTQVSGPLNSEYSVTGAYNTRNNRYLAVWVDERNGNPDIYGQIYDEEGFPEGSNFAVHESSGILANPNIAFNSIDQIYLVTWYNKQDVAIEWQLISSQGLPLHFGRVALAEAMDRHPVSAYNSPPEYNEFVILYEDLIPGETNPSLAGIRIDGTYGNDGTSGSKFRLSSPGSNMHSPDIEYHAGDQSYMVVWQDNRDDPGDIYGMQISYNGSPNGSEFLISQAGDGQQYPDLIWNPDDDEYLVVWQDYRTSGASASDIYGQRLNAQGGLLGSNFAIANPPGTSNQQMPAGAYVNALNRYRVVWQDDRDDATKLTGWDIRGQWVNTLGNHLGLYDDIVFRYPGWQTGPAIIYNTLFNRLLTLWEDGRNGVEYDIYGRFSRVDTTPPVARFTIDDSRGLAGDTFALNAWPSYDADTPRLFLAARWDFNSDGIWDTNFSYQKYITRTIYNPGIYTVTLEIQNQAWLTDTVSHHCGVPTDGKLALTHGTTSDPAAHSIPYHQSGGSCCRNTGVPGC